MPSLILPCANCQSSTLHRSPVTDQTANGKQPETVKCDACGTVRPVPVDNPDGTNEFTIDATRLLATLPALSQKNAHGKLEDLLYEHRSAIEGSDAFCDAIASTNATEVEMQDIKVQKYRAEQAAVFVDFTFYALGERDEEQENRRFRVDGTGIGRIDNQGTTEIQDVTAAISDV